MAEMVQVHTLSDNQEYMAGSSSHQYEREVPEEGINSKKGSKPSLAERNRERQQRFRQRQKSRIEELETRCVRLTQQTRTLTSEKEEMAKSLALLKDLVQVRELQIVAVTSRLAQLNSGPNTIKPEIAGLDGQASIEALLQQQPTVQALEAIQSARAGAQPQETLSTAETAGQDQGQRFSAPLNSQPSEQQTQQAEQQQQQQQQQQTPARPSSRASSPQQRPRSPQVAFDQLCRVAEIAERQRAGSSSPTKIPASQPSASGPPSQPFVLPTPLLAAPLLAGAAPLLTRPTPSRPSNPPSIFSRMSRGFEQCADVTLVVESQQVVVHSALLAAHSAYYAKKFEESKHSQRLYPSEQPQPMVIDTGAAGKRIQDMELFLRHCYSCLDLTPVADADIMRLIMLADEFEAKQLLAECDEAIAARAEGKKFTYFVDLSNGGDMIDWIRLADQLGLAKVSSMCEMHLARHLKENRSGRENARLQELGQECLLRVINQLAEL